MTTVSSARSSQSAFARIAALAVGSKKKAEDDEDTKKSKSEDKKDDDKASDKDDDGSDNDEKKGAKADDEDGDGDENDDGAKKKSAKEDDEDDDKAAEDDDDEDDKKDDEKSKKKAVVKARLSERRRIAAILSCDAAQLSEQHLHSAMNFALMTDMKADHAIAVLSAMPVPAAPKKSNAARERLDQTPNPNISDEGSDSKASLADQIVAAGKKRRGED